MPSWYLVEIERGAMPRWCQIGPGGAWIDGVGRLRPATGQRILLHRNVELDRDLLTDPMAAYLEMPLAGEHLLLPSSESGWVSPDGSFWGCASVTHEWLLHALVRRSVHDVSRDGWIRIAGDIVFDRGAEGPSREIYPDTPMTQRQIDTMADLGFHEVFGRHRRLPEHRRGEEDRTRPFAVRKEDVKRLLERFLRVHGEPTVSGVRPERG